MALRRSPQIQPIEEGTGVTRRRSPRLHPQIQATEEGAGVTRRRSPRLHPAAIQATEEGVGVTRRRIRRRRGTSPAGPSCMPDDDDVLREILVRLPPEPSSLLRASAVCKRWLGLVTDPRFHRQFCAHHRKPPLLGFFEGNNNQGIVFNPILDPPDRIPHVRFSLSRSSSNYVLDCRHGHVLVGHHKWKKTVRVCDPITGEQHRVPVPPRFIKGLFVQGAVLCAAGNQEGHVHGGCHSRPFKVVLISTSTSRGETIARVYSSETGGWGNLISTAPELDVGGTSTLVGNTLYWLSFGDHILEFDLEGQGLSMIMGPPVPYDSRRESRQILQAEDGAVGFAILSYPHLQMWQKNVNNGLDLATWVPWKTIQMDSIVGLPHDNGRMHIIQGDDEDTDIIFLHVVDSVHMVQLNSMQSRKLYGTVAGLCHPFRSFYTPAIRGCDEADDS